MKNEMKLREKELKNDLNNKNMFNTKIIQRSIKIIP